MQPIFLIGFMGCGKSTIGSELADSLSLTYIDTDQLIENNLGCTIPQIFETEGEEAFRNYESRALKQSITANIISTGGGIIKRSENIKFMKDNGKIVYLQTSFSNISARLKNDPSRPLWESNDLDDKINLYEQRLPIYEQCANYIIKTDHRSVDEIVQEIKVLLNL